MDIKDFIIEKQKLEQELMHHIDIEFAKFLEKTGMSPYAISISTVPIFKIDQSGPTNIISDVELKFELK